MPRAIQAVVSLLLPSMIACTTMGDSLSAEPDARLPSSAAKVAPKSEDAWAKQTMDALEGRLEGAQRVEIEFEIQSEGVVASRLSGSLRWTAEGEFSLAASGEFAGAPQQLELRGDAEQLATLVGGEQRWSGARPAALIEAVVVGLTRQGLLHNLALLSAGALPDHAEGGVREWLSYVQPQLGPPELMAGEQLRPLEFEIEVEAQHVGSASLWLDERELPRERHQSVNFPEGEMRVVERYTSFKLE